MSWLSVIQNGWIAVTACAVVTYTLTYIIYNLYFHPLASFPGPFWARASLLWRIQCSMSGRFHRSIECAHQAYGSILRVSPNELTFSTPTSFKSIYGPYPSSAATFKKSDFFDIFGAGFSTGCIVSERDPARHARMKRLLLPAFSTRALLGQEDIVQGCIDNFVARVKTAGESPSWKGKTHKGEWGLDMTVWYGMLAFDILGEMAFGESFHCVEDGKPNSWQQMIAKHVFFITAMDNLRRYPAIRWVGVRLLPWVTVDAKRTHTGFCRDKIRSRLASTAPRKDFLTDLVEETRSGEMSTEELTAHASTLVLAGGETVATFLAAVTFYLCKSPVTKHKLQQEIDSHFHDYHDISSSRALQLPYLQAVISEGLRIYPPSAQSLPRISPGAVIDGQWIPAGTEVYSSVWTVNHDFRNFAYPDEFLPERWLDAESKDIKEASQPFSVGPSSCIARSFAHLEMSLILTKLFFTYDMELVDKDLDWEGQSHVYLQWRKPELKVRLAERKI